MDNIINFTNGITRFIEADEVNDYVLPAITLGKYEKAIQCRDSHFRSPQYERKIHIGIDKGNSKVACLCGQHHRQPSDLWKSPSIESSPNITCGSCIRAMRAILRKSSSKSYILVIRKIGQKIKDAQFHDRQKGASSNCGNKNYIVIPEPRVANNLITSDTSILLNALSKPLYEKPPREIKEGEPLKLIITAIPDYVTSASVKCKRCCFSTIDRPCPVNIHGTLVCNHMSPSGKTIFVELLKPV